MSSAHTEAVDVQPRTGAGAAQLPVGARPRWLGAALLRVVVAMTYAFLMAPILSRVRTITLMVCGVRKVSRARSAPETPG